VKIKFKLATLALLAGSILGIAHAQRQNELSWSVKSNLSSFVTYSNSEYSHSVSSTAKLYLSYAARDAQTEEDFKALIVATRILYCHKVLEDLTYSTPNYSQVKSDFELELKNDLTSLKNATR
jgi:hypothetical protein